MILLFWFDRLLKTNIPGCALSPTTTTTSAVRSFEAKKKFTFFRHHPPLRSSSCHDIGGSCSLLFPGRLPVQLQGEKALPGVRVKKIDDCHLELLPRWPVESTACGAEMIMRWFFRSPMLLSIQGDIFEMFNVNKFFLARIVLFCCFRSSYSLQFQVCGSLNKWPWHCCLQSWPESLGGKNGSYFYMPANDDGVRMKKYFDV